MTTTMTRQGRGYLLHADQGDATWLLGELHIWKATRVETGGGFALMENRIAPGGEPPLHIHHREAEGWYVLEGELTFTVGDEEFAATPGSFVYSPKGVIHGFRVTSATMARLLVIVTPAGFEGFSREMGRPAEAPTLPPPAAPDLEKLVSLSTKYGLEVVAPPGH